MSATEALREISERLIRLTNDERRERKSAIEEGRVRAVVVGRAEDIGNADSDGPMVGFEGDADMLANLRREALDDIEKIVDDVLLRGER